MMRANRTWRRAQPGGSLRGEVVWGRFVAIASLTILIACTGYSIFHLMYFGDLARSARGIEWGGIFVYLAIAFVVLLLPMILCTVKRLTTHTVRDWIVRPLLVVNWIVFGISVIFCVGALSSGGGPNTLIVTFGTAAISLAAIIFLTLMMPPILAFAIPSSRYSIWFWMLSIMTLLSPYTILAGLWMPPHRRLKEYWKPRRLPRLPPSQSGMTLIELLIAVAILAILSVSFSIVSGVGSQTTARQERRREALDLAEDAFAQLRAMPALPAAGVHPLDGAAAELHPDLKNKAHYEIAPGPRPGTARVDLTIDFNDDLDRQTINLVAILPSGAPR